MDKSYTNQSKMFFSTIKNTIGTNLFEFYKKLSISETCDFDIFPKNAGFKKYAGTSMNIFNE